MKYHVYMAANNSILHVSVDSDTAPVESGPELVLGESQFKYDSVLAVVPDGVFKGDAAIVAGRG